MKNFIPVNKPLLEGNEKKYLNECIDTGWISSEGNFVREFENKFAKKMNRKFAVTVTNGTAALELVIERLELQPGDEVIVPTFTIISCITQILRRGAKPVLVDCHLDTWNTSIKNIEKKINKKTKAIMVVHIYGLPVDMDPIINICKKNSIILIEDSAEMHGQTYKGSPCGSFGFASTFSFYPNKHITTGEGGMILTDDENFYKSLCHYKNLCFGGELRYEHNDLGWNMRFTNLQAAVGLAQLEKLDEFVIKKRAIGQKYNSLLEDSRIFDLPPKETSYAKSIYWVYGLLIKKDFNINPLDIIKMLLKKGIGSRQFFCPMHQQPILKKMNLYNNEKYPISEYLYKKGLYIPSGLGINFSEQEQVVDALFEIEKEIIGK